MSKSASAYRAKDFIQTSEGLIFAIVVDGLEAGKVLCFLRYACFEGNWRKVNTQQANQLLADHYPHYLHHSAIIDAHLHAVAERFIEAHYQPRLILQSLLASPPKDQVHADLQQLCHLLQQQGLDLAEFGVTGSLLVGLQHQDSDIDLICYDRPLFQQARHTVGKLIMTDKCQGLSEADWQEAYQRRACDFHLDEYVWHEQRKFNKAMINGRKFDLSLLAVAHDANGGCFVKQGFISIEALVVDDAYSFDYPAMFAIDHLQADHVVCFTATYIGQAVKGERIEVSGQLEIDKHGAKRIVVGSNREAIGEYIRVIR